MTREKEFVSADIYLCAFLSIILNLFPSFRLESGKILFVFPSNAALYKAISAYNSGTLINGFEFASQIKRLRAEMLSRKQGGGVLHGESKKV